ncbi:hypothetical protein AVO45_09590 [Ruegeria marisrubri]|uniref:Uncharacterized protein n=1 Tax=Ruegeria marisrubri TaxID=1685379 RepID=A0A0X3TLV5_9RHOB|nr:periplasmic heavy metal sensor [Ruegeria marisrubri]KUJ76752.1 hypothetical protein AVO45_09590 [Ruegeria marisrubri]
MSDEKPKKRRWVPILLGVSLALNLVVVGVIVGAALRFHGGERVRHTPGFGPVLYRALPEEDRQALRSRLHREHGEGSKEHEEDFRALTEALRAVPFDAGSVQALIDQQADERAAAHLALNRAWLDRVSRMTDDERREYADRIEEVIERGKHRKRYRDH